MVYLARVVDSVIQGRLAAMGGVLIDGPRASGKTATGLHHSTSSVRIDSSPEFSTVAEVAPASLLQGPTPRLIDEWQLAPALWNAVRHEIDDRGKPGQFILSGSATPADDVTRHSGVGRIARVRLRTMSLAESGRSSKQVSLAELLGTKSTVAGTSSLSYPELVEEAVRGGWPSLLSASARNGQIFNREYGDELCRTDIPVATGTDRDPDKMRRMLASLARNISTEVSLSTLGRDAGNGAPLDQKTVRAYLSAFSQVFALEPLPAWSVNLRSRTRLRTASTIQLADPALACGLLGAGVDRLVRDPEFFGLVFESMAVRDLRVYASHSEGRLFRYRDSSGLEVDAVMEFPDGSWAAAEVKLGGSAIEHAAANLIKLREDRVDIDRVGKPKFLAVVTATEYAYTLPSGVHVIPLATLNP